VELKRSLIDVETEIQQTITAKVQTQLSVSSWEGSRNDDTFMEMTETPRTVANLRDDLRKISNKLKEFESRKADLLFRISDNEQKVKKLQEELPLRVKNEDMRNFLQLLYRNQVLEIESMELAEQANSQSLAQKEILAQKQLEIEKLNLQVSLRDKIISEIKAFLTPDQLELFNAKIINKHVSYLPLTAPSPPSLIENVENNKRINPAKYNNGGIFPSFSAYRKAALNEKRTLRGSAVRAKSEFRLR